MFVFLDLNTNVNVKEALCGINRREIYDRVEKKDLNTNQEDQVEKILN